MTDIAKADEASPLFRPGPPPSVVRKGCDLKIEGMIDRASEPRGEGKEGRGGGEKEAAAAQQPDSSAPPPS